MLRIIADENIPFLKGVLEPYAYVKYMPGNLIIRDSLLNVDALIIRSRTKCDKSLLEGTAVKFIATATIGFDHIDTEYCKSVKIQWVNAPGCNSSSVQQYFVAAMLMYAHRYDFDLSQKTLGIIGVGNVGSKIRFAAQILGINVKLNDPPRARKEGSAGFTDLDGILETCDIITLHVPLITKGEDQTFHLFDSSLFHKVKDGAWLINTSRGEVVKTNALKAALSSRKLNGVVLDVWENEPKIDLELLRQVYIATPHIAGYSTDGKANGTAMVVQALSHYFNLPLLNFRSISLPEPSNPVIVIDGTGKPGLQIVREAVMHSYAITRDHTRLQISPETFEQQRGAYPTRREFSSYKVKLSNGKTGATEILEKLGFKVQIDI